MTYQTVYRTRDGRIFDTVEAAEAWAKQLASLEKVERILADHGHRDADDIAECLLRSRARVVEALVGDLLVRVEDALRKTAAYAHLPANYRDALLGLADEMVDARGDLL